jgi:hypothetical protein
VGKTHLIQQSPELPSTLQSWWDREGLRLPLLLVLCGSQLSTMRELGMQTAPLFGRFNAGIWRLEPLDYGDSALFSAARGRHRVGKNQGNAGRLHIAMGWGR